MQGVEEYSWQPHSFEILLRTTQQGLFSILFFLPMTSNPLWSQDPEINLLINGTDVLQALDFMERVYI